MNSFHSGRDNAGTLEIWGEPHPHPETPATVRDDEHLADGTVGVALGPQREHVGHVREGQQEAKARVAAIQPAALICAR